MFIITPRSIWTAHRNAYHCSNSFFSVPWITAIVYICACISQMEKTWLGYVIEHSTCYALIPIPLSSLFAWSSLFSRRGSRISSLPFNNTASTKHQSRLHLSVTGSIRRTVDMLKENAPGLYMYYGYNTKQGRNRKKHKQVFVLICCKTHKCSCNFYGILPISD